VGHTVENSIKMEDIRLRKRPEVGVANGNKKQMPMRNEPTNIKQSYADIVRQEKKVTSLEIKE